MKFLHSITFHIRSIRLVMPVALALIFKQASVYAQEPVLLLSSNLPIILIDTGGQEIQDTVKITATMRVIDNSTNRRNLITDTHYRYDGLIGIEYRGSSSTQFPKKQFAVETRDTSGANFNVSLLDMPAENDWVLYAPYSDKSLMRNVLAYKLWNDLGHYASRTRFFELMINGRYWGVYVLMEKIKRDKNRVAIAELDSSEVTAPAVTGGYILKIDKLAGENNAGRQSAMPPWFQGAWGIKPIYLYHYPKPDKIQPQQAAYIDDFIDRFEKMMASDGYDDPAGGMWTALDMESVIDYCIMNELSKNIDGYRLSAFIYKDRDDRDPRLHLGPVWDFNIAFGNASYNGGDTAEGWMIEFFLNDSLFNTNPKVNLIPFWWGKIWYSPRFQNRLYLRWQELRRRALDIQEIDRFIDQTALQLDEAQQRNFRCWPILGVWVWPNKFIGADYQQEVDYLKQWLKNRILWMDENLHFSPAKVNDETEIVGAPLMITPNPFNNSTTIVFTLDRPAPVELAIYNLAGQRVRLLLNEPLPVGEHRASFSADDLASGVYFCRLSTIDGVQVQKLVLQR